MGSPLVELQTNVARVPLTVLREAKEHSIDAKLDLEDSVHWKTLLSPVVEESPSPRKDGLRKVGVSGSNSHLDSSPRGRNRQSSQQPGQNPQAISSSEQPAGSLSPGSIKLQNFLKRLERQGLSHD